MFGPAANPSEMLNGRPVKETLLLVEDHKDSRDLLLRYLARHGIQATACEDAYAALEWMRSNHPSVVVLDEDMPGLSGTGLFQMMRQDPMLRDVPVIFFSAHFEARWMARALSDGAVDWLVKGVHGLDRLLAAIQRAGGATKSA